MGWDSGFWVAGWDCGRLRAWDFPTERVLSRTPLIIRTVDHTVTVYKILVVIIIMIYGIS